MDNPPDWRPSSSIETLKERAALLSFIRHFFAARQVLEVETPLLCASGVTDPFVENFVTQWTSSLHTPLYLQTSPEYAMKRLLASGTGAIYQICKAFRDESVGHHHNPEFTLLEWYQPEYTINSLMLEVAELVGGYLGVKAVESITYAEAFQRHLHIDLKQVSDRSLQEMANRYARSSLDLDRDGCLDLLLTHAVEPAFPENTLVFLTEFPESKAALARIAENKQGERVALRFELYVNGLELANGYYELLDAEEQKKRFVSDQLKRQSLGLPERPADKKLIEALEAGLPECSGVALGVDRLLLLKTQQSRLSQVITFDSCRA